MADGPVGLRRLAVPCAQLCLQGFDIIVKLCRNIALERCQIMDVRYSHEKFLIIVALTLCAGILFYNAFFIPQISIPSVIYVDANENNESSNPSIESETDSSNGSDGTENRQNKSVESSSKVNINTATAEELEKLDGIGPAIAKRIVEYRNTNGKFLSIDEVKNVSGIGEKTFAKFKDDICV